LSPVETIGWVLSIGLIGGIVAINPAHELIDKSNLTEQTIGGLLLATVCYGTFKVEHLAGHHVDVATPAVSVDRP
jgi:alkane 1-monooxygenase